LTMTLKNGDLNRGLDLFNRGHFFDAHEALEDVWRSLPRHAPSYRRLRLHVQGMVQLAVAFHHQSKGNHLGAHSVLTRALRNLDGADTSFPDLDFERLHADLALWQQFLDEKRSDESDVRLRKAPALPKIIRRR
jgi:predicted metal-dependent hydrolase